MTHILIIDDERELLQLVADNLMLTGYQVSTATDGWEGIEIAQAQRPDIILCDIMMPELDGHSVLLELRALPELARIPFLFLTARADYMDLRYGMLLGADDYLVKPIPHEELVQAIEARLQKAQTTASSYIKEINHLRDSLDQQQEHQLSTNRFLSMIAHDMKTYLAALSSSAQLIRLYGERMSAERHDDHLGRIESNVQSIVYMLDDLMMVNYSRADGIEPKFAVVDLLGTVEETIREVESLSNKHTLHLQVGTTTERYAEIDEHLIKQALVNLISNAIKYSPNTSDIQIRLGYADGIFTLQVIDRGIGIPKDALQQLFHTFYRAANVGNIPGTGIGLAIVHQITEMHQGRITIESEVGRGTSICLHLPQKQAIPSNTTH